MQEARSVQQSFRLEDGCRLYYLDAEYVVSTVPLYPDRIMLMRRDKGRPPEEEMDKIRRVLKTIHALPVHGEYSNKLIKGYWFYEVTIKED